MLGQHCKESIFKLTEYRTVMPPRCKPGDTVELNLACLLTSVTWSNYRKGQHMESECCFPGNCPESSRQVNKQIATGILGPEIPERLTVSCTEEQMSATRGSVLPGCRKG